MRLVLSRMPVRGILFVQAASEPFGQGFRKFVHSDTVVNGRKFQSACPRPSRRQEFHQRGKFGRWRASHPHHVTLADVYVRQLGIYRSNLQAQWTPYRSTREKLSRPAIWCVYEFAVCAHEILPKRFGGFQSRSLHSPQYPPLTCPLKIWRWEKRTRLIPLSGRPRLLPQFDKSLRDHPAD